MQGAITDPLLSAQIKSYEPMLHPLARRLSGRDGAEEDDLMQEGFIAVWQCIAAGKTPSKDICYKRMLNWLRHIRPQLPAPYDEIVALTDGW